MAAQPFDKATADKLIEAFNNLNSETKDTLSNLEAIVDAEKKMVDIAKQLGQVYKTQKDKINEQLKGKSLQEKLTELHKNSEKKLNEFAQARINSHLQINKLNEELLELAAKLNFQESQDPNSKEVIELKNQINKKRDLVNLEEQLLKNSNSVFDSLKQQNLELEIQSKVMNRIKEASDVIAKELNIPTSFTELLGQTYKRFREIDAEATKIRQTFALFRNDAAGLEKQIRDTGIELAGYGATATDVATTISTLSKNFNTISGANTALVKDVTILSKQFGITAERSATFLKTIGGITGQSADSKKNMLGLAGAASKAYGVGLDDVMKDVADASEEARMYAGKNAEEMVRAAAQARQMGTSLDNMARTAKGLLDFESSIQAELKASALIGKNINFNEARRLAFQGKVVEANKLILDQAKKIKFNQLNPIAQEAFAKAAGKTVKELQDMLESETRIKDALNSKDEKVREIAKKQLEEQKILKQNPKLAQERFEKDLLTKKNQERIVELQNKINQQLQKLMLPTLEAITKVMDKLVELVDKFKPEELIGPLIKIRLMFTSWGIALRESLLFPLRVASGYLSKLGEVGWIKSLLSPITSLIQKIKIFTGNFQYAISLGSNFAQAFLSAGKSVGGIFSKIGKILSYIAKPIDFIISTFKILKTLASSIFSPIINAIKPIIGAFKSVGEGSKFLKPLLGFLKIGKLGLTAVPVLGEIIMAIEFIWNAWKRISTIFNDPNLNLGQKIFASVVSIYGALYDTLIQPFIDIGEWIIKAVWGEDILKGIKAVVNDIFDLLKWPFEKAYNWIMDRLGGKSPSELGLSIVVGIKSVVDMLFDLITYPFKKAGEIIPGIIDILKTTFVDAFKSVVDVLFDVITYPFKKAFELIKSAVTEVGSVFKDIFSSAFNFIVKGLELVWEKIKGIGSFISEMFSKSFNFIGKIFTSNEETKSTAAATGKETVVANNDLLINTIVNTNKNIVDRLDKLTSLMASGQIAVYIDGQRANQILASTGVKFGSFGQATTN